MKITKIYNDAKDKNVAKTVLFYASNDETKTLYYEPTLKNEVSKDSLVDFFLKGLVIQAVENGERVGEYEMPTTLGESKGGSGGSVEPVVLYGNMFDDIDDLNYYLSTTWVENLPIEEAVQSIITTEELIKLTDSNTPIFVKVYRNYPDTYYIVKTSGYGYNNDHFSIHGYNTSGYTREALEYKMQNN